MTILLLITTLGGLLPLAGASDRWETLKAINWVENPTNHARFGPKGELGPYQFRSQTWRQYTKRPFSEAVQREVSDEVAVKHYEWIRRGLEAKGIEPSPSNIAMVWNSGLTSVVSGRVPSSTYRYAELVNNLVDMFKQRQRATTTAVASSRVSTPSPAKVAPVVISLDAPPALFSVSRPSTAPRFVIALAEAESAEIPVVRTDKSVPAPASARPLFATASVGPPRFALLD